MLFLGCDLTKVLVEHLLVVAAETELVDAELVDVALLVNDHVLDVDQLL